ncbi:hypothetical protein EV426DRAFT_590568 [Tirmania nivea]|nr:hypothetical protein EV426DRAFT_590568 [Tirmania nivea]
MRPVPPARYISIAGSPETKRTPRRHPSNLPQFFVPEVSPFYFAVPSAATGSALGWLHRVVKILSWPQRYSARAAPSTSPTLNISRGPLAEARRPLTLPQHRIHSHLPSPGGTERNSKAKGSEKPVVKRAKKTLPSSSSCCLAFFPPPSLARSHYRNDRGPHRFPSLPPPPSKRYYQQPPPPPIIFDRPVDTRRRQRCHLHQTPDAQHSPASIPIGLHETRIRHIDRSLH